VRNNNVLGPVDVMQESARRIQHQAIILRVPHKAADGANHLITTGIRDWPPEKRPYLQQN